MPVNLEKNSMEINIRKNNLIKNPGSKDFYADYFFPENAQKLPVIIFCHGYKGFKDWGAWDMMGAHFAKQGFLFVKFNFSHNGTTLEQPEDFADLESFGQNNYSKELNDLDIILAAVERHPNADTKKISLIGHSRAGGIVVLKAFEDVRVKAAVTWAGISNLNRFPRKELFEQWKENGVFYIENARTRQRMPHYYQYYEDYMNNEQRLNVQYAAQHFEKPLLILHGTNDEAVKIKEAELLHEWAKTSELKIIQGGTHTFNTVHPWSKENLSSQMEEAVNNTVDFLKNAFSKGL